MHKLVTIDFFKVEVPRGVGQAYEELLRLVAAKPLQERNRNQDFFTLRLQALEDWNGNLVGDMIKIRMNDLPSKAGLSGDVALLPLTPSEGTGEGSAFLYDSRNKTLVLQRNRYNLSSVAFSSYITSMGGIDLYIPFFPVIHPDTIKKMERMEVIRKLEISYAGLENIEAFEGEGFSPLRLVNILKDYKSPKAHITLSMGKRKGTLSLVSVRSTVRRFLKFLAHEESSVDVIKVTGAQSEDGPADVLDLLKDRLIYEQEVPVIDRMLRFEDRLAAVKVAWTTHKTNLGRMFSKPGT